MVSRDLCKTVPQKIKSAVPHICHVHHVVLDRSGNQSGPHSFPVRVSLSFLKEPLIRLLQSFSEDHHRTGRIRIFNIFFHMFHDIPGREIPGLMSAHSVCHDEQIRKRSHRLIRCKQEILIGSSHKTGVCLRVRDHDDSSSLR